MKFVIRDDDTCAVTKPDEIRNCYKDLPGNIPVSLSVTPFRVPGVCRFIPKTYYGSTTPLPLDSNHELVAFLREGIKSGRVDISIHGYHHWAKEGGPEYVVGNDLHWKTLRAKQYLSELLGLTINSFVPPHNSLGKQGFRAVVSSGLNLVHIASLWSAAVRDPEPKTWQHMPVVYWHRKVRGRACPSVLNFRSHKEIAYHTVGPEADRRTLINEFEYCAAHAGVFVLATHYHAFDLKIRSGETVRAMVYELVDRAVARGQVEFAGISRVW